MFIDLFLSGLVAGYHQARTARRTLLEKWRFVVLRAYAQKRQAHEQRMDRIEQRKGRWRRIIPWAVTAFIGLCLWGYWTFFSDLCLGSVIGLFSLFGAGLALGGWFLSTRKPEPPKNPRLDKTQLVFYHSFLKVRFMSP